MANYINFRTTTKATYDANTKDNSTLYLMPSDKLIGLGTNVFYSDAFNGASYNASNGVLTFNKANGTSDTIDLPTEMIFDGEASYYDSTTKELVMVFANSSGEVRIDFQAIADKILQEVSSLETDLTDGTITVRYAETAQKDGNEQVIHETYATIVRVDALEQGIIELENTKADTTYLEQRIQDLATKHGLEDSNLGSLATGETISNTVMTEQLKVILNVRLDANGDFSVIQPNKFEIGDTHTFEIGTGAVGTRETATLTKTDASTWTFTSSDATAVLNLTGLKIKELMELGVDNQDENRTDLLSFAIIDGKLAYEIKESE